MSQQIDANVNSQNKDDKKVTDLHTDEIQIPTIKVDFTPDQGPSSCQMWSSMSISLTPTGSASSSHMDLVLSSGIRADMRLSISEPVLIEKEGRLIFQKKSKTRRRRNTDSNSALHRSLESFPTSLSSDKLGLPDSFLATSFRSLNLNRTVFTPIPESNLHPLKGHRTTDDLLNIDDCKNVKKDKNNHHKRERKHSCAHPSSSKTSSKISKEKRSALPEVELKLAYGNLSSTHENNRRHSHHGLPKALDTDEDVDKDMTNDMYQIKNKHISEDSKNKNESKDETLNRRKERYLNLKNIKRVRFSSLDRD